MAATNPNNPDEIPLELTQEEIWDDSTLVETWDEALREYKKYHSIVATGENVEALLKTVESGGVVSAQAHPEEEVKDTPAEAEVKPVVIKVEEKTPGPESAQEPVEPPPQPELVVQNQIEPPAFPFAQQHPAGPGAGYAIGGNDESMRNLMMAWYWAGYYTGLQEGQQKAQQQQLE